jgi:hypothetical protein
MSLRGKTKLKVNGDKSLPITLGFGPNSNSAGVDVKNVKVIRIRLLYFDWKYGKKAYNPWKMKARGKVFEAGEKSLLAPYCLAYKKRTYFPNRILYPLKRVDWNPDGQRNPASRGKSKYVRISWYEAGDIVANKY